MAAKILMTSFLVGVVITAVGFTASVQGWQTVNLVASRLMVPVSASKQSDKRQRASQPLVQLTGRRFVASLLLVLVGALLVVFAGLNPYDYGRFVRASLIAIGFGFNAGGLFFWWAAFALPWWL